MTEPDTDIRIKGQGIDSRTRQIGVRRRYGEIGSQTTDDGSGCWGTPSAGHAVSAALGYSDDELAAVAPGADQGLGCGNPVAIGKLEPGDSVLDLGSGGGFDCFLAAQEVGERGTLSGSI